MYFDLSKKWVILYQETCPALKKCIEDLSRYIELLSQKPEIIAANTSSADAEAKIVLSCKNSIPEKNGFEWIIGTEKVEIYGESCRGLCNGIYNFLSALGISWPSPGKELLPSKRRDNSFLYPILSGNVSMLSHYNGNTPANAPWRRFVTADKNTIKKILKRSDEFTAWAARQRFDAIVLPFALFSSGAGKKLKKLKAKAAEYSIALEAGGRELSSFVPRNRFYLNKEFFRMEDGRRRIEHHFCPTNPDTIKIIRKEGRKMFLAAGEVKVFHLWPDREAERAWCSCPSCRAFSQSEQNRIAVNAAADALAEINQNAFITFYEEAGKDEKVPLRKNLFKMESLPEESFL